MIILDPAMKKEDMDVLLTDIESEISKNQGTCADVQRMGRRKLEHPIRKHPEGYFVQMNFNADPSAIAKLTNKFLLKETILRFFFVLREDGFVKFKSFDENAPTTMGYSQDAPGR